MKLPENFFELAGGVFQALENNILCGNSLIDKDVDTEDSIAFSQHMNGIGSIRLTGIIHFLKSCGREDLIWCSATCRMDPSNRTNGFNGIFSVTFPYIIRQADRSAYFIERGLSLLCPGGMLGCIAGNRWLRAKSGSFLRKHMLSFQFEEIIDFGTEAEDKLHPSLCIIRIARRPASHKFFATHLDSTVLNHWKYRYIWQIPDRSNSAGWRWLEIP